MLCKVEVSKAKESIRSSSPFLICRIPFSESIFSPRFRESLSFHTSSHLRCSVRKGVLRNFAKFTGEHLCQSPFFNKVVPQLEILLKKRLCHRCFPVIFAKFLRKPFLQNTSGRLFLQIYVTLYSTYLLNDKNYNTYFLIICFYRLRLVRLIYFCRFPDFELQRNKVQSRKF